MTIEAARAHARGTDPVTSDRTVKSIAKDGTLSYWIWYFAKASRHRGFPFNDTQMTEWIEDMVSRRQQRNVVARARGLMEDAGLLRQAGIFPFRGRDLMHYEIHPDNPKEHSG